MTKKEYEKYLESLEMEEEELEKEYLKKNLKWREIKRKRTL